MDLENPLRRRIAALPDEGMDLDDNHIGGILARYTMARELLCILCAKDEWTDMERAQLDALAAIVERDVPALLRAATHIPVDHAYKMKDLDGGREYAPPDEPAKP